MNLVVTLIRIQMLQAFKVLTTHPISGYHTMQSSSYVDVYAMYNTLLYFYIDCASCIKVSSVYIV